MKKLPDLPPKYYLTHFLEFLQDLEGQCENLLREEHRNFMGEFYSLGEDAQCLYVRMLNRKGKFFFQDDLIYEEISDQSAALKELNSKLFALPPVQEDWQEIIAFLPKNLLMEVLSAKQIEFKKSTSKGKLQELCQECCPELPHDLLQNIIVQGKTLELEYLIFLYFGAIQSSLTLYTLRDLGIKRTNNYQGGFKPRFQSKAEAESHYFYAKLAYDLDSATELASWPEALNPESKALRDCILLSLAQAEEAPDKSLLYYSLCGTHPAREKRARLLWKLERKEECQALLNEMLDDPRCEEEVLFAEDFLARRFEKKRMSVLTETLQKAELLWIDEGFFRHPELGVVEHLQAQGYEAFHTENHLWNLLFGLLFWEELFCHEKSSFHNPFDLLPSDLLNGTFYENHQERISTKLELFADKEKLLAHLERVMEQHQAEQLGIFSWDEIAQNMLRLFINQVNLQGLSCVMETMARDYNGYSSGFPDLLAIKEGEVSFFEIKAKGDSLRQNQLKIMKLMGDAGIKVEILRVDYRMNPEQTYLVVDLETTGARAEYDRITEIGAVKMRNGEVIETFQTLINPGRSIPKFIQDLTGINNEMVKNAPTFSEIAEKFLEFSQGCIFVAHNVNFDYKFLQQEYARLDMKYVRPFICTKAGMRKHYPKLPSYSLGELTRQFAIPLENHHRALCDAQAAAGLLLLINEKRLQSSGEDPV